MKKIIFAIGEPEDENEKMGIDNVKIIENYSFEFEYNEDEVNLQVGESKSGKISPKIKVSEKEKPTIDVLKKNTSSLLRHLISLSSTLKPLPEKRVLTMRIYYTPSAPNSYQPTHFKECPNKPFNWNNNGSMVKLRLGNVKNSNSNSIFFLFFYAF